MVTFVAVELLVAVVVFIVVFVVFKDNDEELVEDAFQTGKFITEIVFFGAYFLYISSALNGTLLFNYTY